MAADCTGGKNQTDCYCGKTCENYQYTTCDEQCDDPNPGCDCPDGQVDLNGECVLEENCPCMWLGIEYRAGDTVKQNCKEW